MVWNSMLGLASAALISATAAATRVASFESGHNLRSGAETSATTEPVLPATSKPGVMVIYLKSVEYYLSHGEWLDGEEVDGFEEIEHQIPSGAGPHVIEFAPKGAPDQPVTVDVASTGEIYVMEFAILVNFTSRGGIVFTDDAEATAGGIGPSLFHCNGAYSDVVSYATSGDCWGTGSFSFFTGAWSIPCNGSAGGCSAVITYGTSEPYQEKEPTWNCGTGSASGNVYQKFGFATDADQGC